MNGNLVLSRYAGEAIMIGNDIRVEVIEIRHSGVVRLRITAPPDVRIDREEVRERKEREGTADAPQQG